MIIRTISVIESIFSIRVQFKRRYKCLFQKMNVNAIWMFTFFNVLEIHVVPNTAQICKPTILEGKDGKLDIGGYTYIACHTTSCNKNYTVRYEKTNPNTPAQWTPVYELVNKTYNHTIMAGNTNYTLQNRTDFADFGTHHILSIRPLKLEDQGGWRCAVYDNANYSVESSAINIYIKEIGKILSPKEELIIGVNPNSTFTLNCSGFGNAITWQKNDVDVTNDRYSYNTDCNNESGICTSYMTSKPVEVPWTCENVMAYAGVYTCVVTQNASCTSKHTSPKMTVQVFHKPFAKEVSRNITACKECEVTLSCDICYDKKSTYTWTYNEETLPNETVVYKDDGSVMINKIHHFGKYTRTVKNELGEAQCELNLSSCGIYCNSNVVAFVLLALGCLVFFITGVCVGVYVWKRKYKNNLSTAGENGSRNESIPLHTQTGNTDAEKGSQNESIPLHTQTGNTDAENGSRNESIPLHTQTGNTDAENGSRNESIPLHTQTGNTDADMFRTTNCPATL